MSTKTTKKKEPTSWLKMMIEFFRSAEGHAVIILVMSGVLVIITALVFQDALLQSGRLTTGALFLGISFALVFELGTFFLAVNTYNTASWTVAFLSVIILRATFGEMIPDNETHSLLQPDTWNSPFLVSWILSVFPPVMVAYTSHKLAYRMGLKTKRNGLNSTVNLILDRLNLTNLDPLKSPRLNRHKVPKT